MPRSVNRNAKTKTKAEVKTEAKTEAKAETKAEAKAEAKTETKAKLDDVVPDIVLNPRWNLSYVDRLLCHDSNGNVNESEYAKYMVKYHGRDWVVKRLDINSPVPVRGSDAWVAVARENGRDPVSYMSEEQQRCVTRSWMVVVDGFLDDRTFAGLFERAFVVDRRCVVMDGYGVCDGTVRYVVFHTNVLDRATVERCLRTLCEPLGVFRWDFQRNDCSVTGDIVLVDEDDGSFTENPTYMFIQDVILKRLRTKFAYFPLWVRSSFGRSSSLGRIRTGAPGFAVTYSAVYEFKRVGSKVDGGGGSGGEEDDAAGDGAGAPRRALGAA